MKATASVFTNIDPMHQFASAARVQMEDVAAQAASEMVEQLTGLKIDRSDPPKAVATEIEI